MISRWNQFPLDIPFDGQFIWCRIDRWAGRPFLATFHLAEMQVVSFENALTYDFWMISAWQDADPIPAVPDYPIEGIYDPDTQSEITNYDSTSPFWDLRFLKTSANQNAENFSIQLAILYSDASQGNPPAAAFENYDIVQQWNQTGPNRFRYGGVSSSAAYRNFLMNRTFKTNRTVISGFRMFVRYRVIHIPTGFTYPWQIESVLVL